MKYFGIVFLFVISQVYCRSLSSPKVQDTQENEVDFNEVRSARVHRVSNDGYSLVSFENAESNMPITSVREDLLDEKADGYLEELKELPTSKERELQNVLSELYGEDIYSSDYDKREAQLMKQLTLIFKELSGSKGLKLKNFDITINEVKDTITSPNDSTALSNNIDTLPNELHSPKDLGIYYQGGEEKEESVKAKYKDNSKSPSSFHFKLLSEDGDQEIENTEQYLDGMLKSVQNQMKHIRSDFELLCRKHHAVNGKKASNIS